MTRLVSFSGVVIEAAPESVPRLLKSGMFNLAEGEGMPLPEPEPQEEPEANAEPAAEAAPSAIDRGAFGSEGDEGEDLSSLTVAQLREIAADRGVSVPSKANKATIIGLIQAGG